MHTATVSPQSAMKTKTGSRHIRKVAVLGSGVMGSGIACHFANIGLEVLMLDILPPNLSADQAASKAARNSIADSALATALKSKPAPLYQANFAQRIRTGNFEDDLKALADMDWIIEVVVERLDIKQQLLEKVDAVRKPGTLITTNTSGIPIHMIAEGRSEDFKKHFCGTHFFNPPRYLRLFEVIPGPDTSKEVVDFLMHYGDLYLGKQSVLAKDTPAFIGNRIGVYAMNKVFHLAAELGLRIEDVDKLTGPALGRPKTGTFRLGDLVGLDTALKVVEGIRQNCPHDEQAAMFTVPASIKHLVDNKWLGNKSGQGFYKKTDQRDEKGKPVVLGLDLKTLEYTPAQKSSLPSLEQSKQMENLQGRLKMFLYEAKDAGAELVRRSLLGLFAYSSNRIPEIADQLYSIDDALRAGFAWELGPFQYWDAVGVAKATEMAEAQGEKVAPWVHELLAQGHQSFYKVINDVRCYYNIQQKDYVPMPGTEAFIVLDDLRGRKAVYENAEATLHDIGDGVLCLEFRSKANSLGEGVLKGINEAIRIAEEEGWNGLVIGNNAPNFSVGANLMMIGMMAFQQEWEELNFAVKYFQDTMMRCRYSSIPVVAATQGYVFGGGCEMIMHCDSAITAAESYIGLVEVGVGLLPGGGGTKEFALRAGDSYFPGDVQIPTLIEKFKTIAMASVATSAHEAFGYGYLNTKDRVVVNTGRNLSEAKARVLELAKNYTQPVMRTDVTVLGRTGLGALHVAANELRLGNYASEHDIKIAHKIAWVLCGGDLTGTQKVSERYLLDIEREAFLSLCGEPKTLERVQYMLQNNKPLRN